MDSRGKRNRDRRCVWHWKTHCRLFRKTWCKGRYCNGHTIKAAEETVAEIKALGADATFIQCDVSKGDQVEAMVAKTVETFGFVDIAFNNAGVGPDGVTIPPAPITKVTESDWDWIVDTNLKGVFLCV